MAEPISTILITSLTVIDKFLDKLPDYDQRKKEEYRRIKAAYLQEKSRADRIDNHLEHYADKLSLFLETFNKELDA